MTSNLDLLINFEPEKGTVKLGDDSVIESCSRGTVRLMAKTSNGCVAPVFLPCVLWVTKLGLSNLLSWRAIVSLGKGFSLSGNGKDIYISRENKTDVLWVRLKDQN